ncbi:alpha/beta fold hydrolase [Streptomyces sp. CB01201]|uniref:alpha/beta fold hydrolase n=1 Tax=Streptomyces sp. CB01201 TaxID=2020324 RepID=UPI001F481398|nr:hypothetical protein [Streptomyces sp. CB01201]
MVEAGSGGPAVVLDAASGTPALTWTPILPVLARHTRVIAYDRAGLGVSDPAAPLTIDSRIDDLAALVSPRETGHAWWSATVGVACRPNSSPGGTRT